MVTDKVLDFAAWVIAFVAQVLPEHHLSLPTLGGIGPLLGKVDSLVPIAGPLAAAVGVLSVVLAFIVVRLALTVWNLIWP